MGKRLNLTRCLAEIMNTLRIGIGVNLFMIPRLFQEMIHEIDFL